MKSKSKTQYTEQHRSRSCDRKKKNKKEETHITETIEKAQKIEETHKRKVYINAHIKSVNK